MKDTIIIFLLCILSLSSNLCELQMGPDPWNIDTDISNKMREDMNVPPDLRMYPKIKPPSSNLGEGEWFFRRMLSIVLKGGQVKKNDDSSVDVSVQMRLDQKRWDTLEEYMQSSTPLTEDMFRRSVGYIEDALYTPTITDKIVMAWSDYVHIYIIEYKMYISWGLAMLGTLGALLWLWRNMSHRHFVIIIFLALYLYEVLISYKEAEKKELDMFMSAVGRCKWYFWTSSCDVPAPDPLIFLKHMNPLKIGIRMFTTLITEPMLAISDTWKTMVHGITDGLWFPLNTITYGILILTFNIVLLILLIMVVFNYILNVPFSFFYGLLSVGATHNNRMFADAANVIRGTENSGNANNNREPSLENSNDRILAILDRFIAFTQISNTNNNGANALQIRNSDIRIPRVETKELPNTSLRRSNSTGRLPNNCSSSFDTDNRLAVDGVKRRNKFNDHRVDGGGDSLD